MEDTTMKKTYMQPDMEVIKLQMNQYLLDGSVTLHSDEEAPITSEDYDALGRENDNEW